MQKIAGQREFHTSPAYTSQLDVSQGTQSINIVVTTDFCQS